MFNVPADSDFNLGGAMQALGGLGAEQLCESIIARDVLGIITHLSTWTSNRSNISNGVKSTRLA